MTQGGGHAAHDLCHSVIPSVVSQTNEIQISARFTIQAAVLRQVRDMTKFVIASYSHEYFEIAIPSADLLTPNRSPSL